MSLPFFEIANRAVEVGGEIGIYPDKPEPVKDDGKRHRCKADGDRGTECSGWYIVYNDDFPTIVCGNWRLGEKRTWTGKSDVELSPEARQFQRDRIAAAVAEEKAQRQRRHAKAAEKAKWLWENLPPADPRHPYLVRKGIQAHGLKQTSGGRLVFPLRDVNGEIRSLQYIAEDGTKRNMGGGQKRGCCFTVPGDTALELLCEGVATAASLYEATNYTVHIAIDADNLKAVARAFQKRAGRYLICGDTDANEVGQESARIAADLLKCRAVCPTFTDAQIAEYKRKTGGDKLPSDFNDLHLLAGLEEVGRQVAALTGNAAREKPLPLRRQPQPQQPYPVDCLLESAVLVRSLAEKTHTPISIVGGEALAAMSLVIQERYNVETTLFGATPTSLFFMGVGDSSLGKDQIDSVLMKAKEEFDENIEAQYQNDMREYEDAMEAYEIDRSKEKKKAKSGAEFVDAVKLLNKPQPPRKPYYTLSDFTYEGVYKHLERGRPAMGIFSSEGASVFGGFAFNDENRAKTISNFSSIWSGREINRGRSNEGVGKLYGRRICSSLLIQPIFAERLFSDKVLSGQGYLYRQLITWPESIPKRYEAISLNALPEVMRFHQRMKRWLTAELPQDPATGRLLLETMPLTNEAEAEYKKFFDFLQDESQSGGKYEIVRGYALKTAENALRIAGTVTGFHCDSCGFGNAPHITKREMIAGIGLATWYLEEVLRIMLNEIASPEILQAEQLLKWFWASKEKTTSFKQVLQYGPGRMREKAIIEPLFSILEEHGWIEPIPGGAMVRIGKKMEYSRRAWAVREEPPAEEKTETGGAANLANPATETRRLNPPVAKIAGLATPTDPEKQNGAGGSIPPVAKIAGLADLLDAQNDPALIERVDL